MWAARATKEVSFVEGSCLPRAPILNFTQASTVSSDY
jgi:hypothetical protein